MNTVTTPLGSMYAIHAVVLSFPGTEGSRSVPLFYLDPIVQGLISEEHAVKVARSILDPFGTDAEIVITATLV